MRTTVGFLFVGALLTVPLAGCGGDSTATSDDLGPPDLATVYACPTGALCTQSTVADQTLVLSDAAQTQFIINGAAGYAGRVNLTIDRSKLAMLSGGVDPYVGIFIVPGSFQMTAGVPKKIDIKLSTTTDAAAFDNMPITVHVADSQDSTQAFDVTFKLTVKPILNITYAGAGTMNSPHTWSTDGLVPYDKISIRSRPGGTTFNFINQDKALHVIHGDGVIKHQPDSGTQPSAAYTLTGINSAPGAAGGFYCHLHQNFNVMQTPTSSTRGLVFVQ